VVAVPASQVVEVAEECGDRGVRALTVITAALTPAQEAGLLAATRRGGMRLAGPASAGLAVPGIKLAATPVTRRLTPGRAGVIVQSGGVGGALLEQFSRLGMGISCFAALGGKLDVSGTDMLLWLESDSTSELAVLHLESFGNPRRFARAARRVGARIPILTVHAGRSAPDQPAHGGVPPGRRRRRGRGGGGRTGRSRGAQGRRARPAAQDGGGRRRAGPARRR
jgi:acyl-CoA synthetase (NDP forming)